MKRLARTPKLERARKRKEKKGKSHSEWLARGKKAVRRFFKKKFLAKRFGTTVQEATPKVLSKVEELLKSPALVKKMQRKVKIFANMLKKKEAEKKSKKATSSAEKKSNSLLPKKGD